MKKSVLKTMLAKNPNVDRTQLLKSLQTLRDLEKAGVVAHTYSINNRRTLHVVESDFVEVGHELLRSL